MQAFLTVESDDDEDYFMVLASKSEWIELLWSIDETGHGLAVTKLISELKSWGIQR